MSTNAESRLVELGIELPEAPEAVGAYVPVLRYGDMVITSGQLPMVEGRLAFAGKVGDDPSALSTERASEAARVASINCLAQIRACVGSLDRVKQVVRVEGFVNSADGFHAQAQVMNGASHLIADIFGAAGQHTRIAVGVSELPLDAAVEVVVQAQVNE